MPTRKVQSVLYVDDDPDICTVVRVTLCRIAGLVVHTAGSGEQAIDLAYELRPDLILMDVMMPGLDGPSTLKRLQEDVLLASIPVIFLTAKVLPAEIDHFLGLGAIGVIGKPFDPVKLHDHLFALWNVSSAARDLDNSPAEQLKLTRQVDTLSGSFLTRTRNDVSRLRAIIERAPHEGRSAMEEAQRIAHAIHGAGAMFGFPQLSATGGAIERLIEHIKSNIAAPAHPTVFTALRQLSTLTDQLASNLDTSDQTAANNAGMFSGLGQRQAG